MRTVHPKYDTLLPMGLLKQKGFFLVIILLSVVIETGSFPAKLFAQAPVISYAGPQNLTEGTAITAFSPANSGGAVSSPAYANSPGTVSIAFNNPYGVAVDASGNVYVADHGSGLLLKFTGGTGTPTTVASGLNGPRGLAIDRSGNLYVADAGNKAIKKIPAGGGTPVIIGPSFNSPVGLAVDASGNVYITEDSTNAVYKLPAGGSGAVTMATGFGNPQGLAVDAAGDLFVCDVSSGLIKVPANGGGSKVAWGTSLTEPVCVAIDGSGNLFVTDLSSLYRLPAGSTSSSVLVNGLYNSAYGVAVDGLNKLYVTDNGNNVLSRIAPTGGYYVNPDIPAGLSFSNATGTFSGTPTMSSAATNYTVSAYNAAGVGSTVVNIAVTGSATLSALKLSNGPLTPAFSAAATNYTAAVANGVTALTVTPTAADPGSTIKVNGAAVASGAASQSIPLMVGPNTITVAVTTSDGMSTRTYTITVTRAASGNAGLSTLGQSVGGLTPAFSSATTSYTENVAYTNTSMTLKPVSSDPNATIKVNGTAVTSGTTTSPIALATGPNTITTVVTAQDGITTKTYTLTVTRLLSAIASLSNLKLNTGTLTPAFATATTGYTVSVANSVATITITPTTTDANATVKVNGTTVTSGTASAAIALAEGGQTAITTVVTAQNGTTKETYTVTVTRGPSANANLSTLGQSVGGLTPGFSPATTSYTENVSNATASMTLKPVSSDAHAAIKVNGTAVTSGTVTSPIALAVGANTVITVVTAQNGVTTKTYTLTVTRAPGGVDEYNQGISVTKPGETPTIADDGIQVHQGVSPNGDGINDFLQIDNIGQYPDNKLTIMNRNGQLIFETKGYDNSSKVFDGHSNKNGQMQLPGTYFYQLDYVVNGMTKHKTGFLVLKY